MEKIAIKNFAGIDNVEITLNQVNVFIGQQASGKSITAKLIFYCKSFVRELLTRIVAEQSWSEIEKEAIARFNEYFPTDTWPNKNFEIVYSVDNGFIIIRKDAKKIKLEVSESIKKIFTTCKRIVKADRTKVETSDAFQIYSPSYQAYQKYHSFVQKQLEAVVSYNPVFVPAGRSFFANLQSNIFSFLSKNASIDPFLVSFGSFYESMKPAATRSQSSLRVPLNSLRRSEEKRINTIVDNIILQILGGQYHREENKDFLLHPDKRKINVSFSSSGQQETLPLLLILKALLKVNFVGGGACLFIEEPEAHLFPAAQKKVIELMGLVYNRSSNNIQLIITTHSPYVLTSLNNLIQASIVTKNRDEDTLKKIYEVVPKDYILDESKLNAYSFKNKTAESIIDTETGLIYSEYLDSVSGEIAIEFDKLLNVEEL